MFRKIFALFVTVSILLSFSSTVSLANEPLTLMLDWFPNVDHIPIYVARDNGMFEEQGLDIRILSPSETSDSLKLAATGEIDIAVAYEPQVIMASSSGIDIRVGGKLAEHPLSTLLFLKGRDIETPSDLEGKKIGYTVPGMMDILLEAFTKINGVNKYDAVNVGFNIIPSLVTGKVDAIMGPYKNYELVELEMEGYEPDHFDIEKMGIPDYDELVFIAGKEFAEKRNKELKAFSTAIGQAIEYTRKEPEKALQIYFEAVPDAPKELETAAFEKTLPLYAHEQTPDKAKWEKFHDFALEYGLIDSRANMDKLLENW